MRPEYFGPFSEWTNAGDAHENIASFRWDETAAATRARAIPRTVAARPRHAGALTCAKSWTARTTRPSATSGSGSRDHPTCNPPTSTTCTSTKATVASHMRARRCACWKCAAARSVPVRSACRSSPTHYDAGPLRFARLHRRELQHEQADRRRLTTRLQLHR